MKTMHCPFRHPILYILREWPRRFTCKPPPLYTCSPPALPPSFITDMHFEKMFGKRKADMTLPSRSLPVQPKGAPSTVEPAACKYRHTYAERSTNLPSSGFETTKRDTTTRLQAHFITLPHTHNDHLRHEFNRRQQEATDRSRGLRRSNALCGKRATVRAESKRRKSWTKGDDKRYTSKCQEVPTRKRSLVPIHEAVTPLNPIGNAKSTPSLKVLPDKELKMKPCAEFPAGPLMLHRGPQRRDAKVVEQTLKHQRSMKAEYGHVDWL